MPVAGSLGHDAGMSDETPASERSGCASILAMCGALPLLLAGLLFNEIVTCSGEGEECFGEAFSYAFVGLPMLVIGLACMCGAALISMKPKTLLLCALPCFALVGWSYVRAVVCGGGDECDEEADAYLVFGLPIQVAGLALTCGAAIMSARPGEKLAAAGVTIGASLVLTIVMLGVLG